jgi:DNA-binding transcriptional MerR regulator
MRPYTIKEASELSGLPESTLRFYETIGIIDPIRRDPSSKHRTYSENDINLVVGIACLNATGMSIGDMRVYLKNRNHGRQGANEQIALLEAQEKRLAEEARNLKLRRRYVAIKVAYWRAIASGDAKEAEAMGKSARQLAKELKLPKER